MPSVLCCLAFFMSTQNHQNNSCCKDDSTSPWHSLKGSSVMLRQRLPSWWKGMNRWKNTHSETQYLMSKSLVFYGHPQCVYALALRFVWGGKKGGLELVRFIFLTLTSSKQTKRIKRATVALHHQHIVTHMGKLKRAWPRHLMLLVCILVGYLCTLLSQRAHISKCNNSILFPHSHNRIFVREGSETTANWIELFNLHPVELWFGELETTLRKTQNFSERYWLVISST